MIRISTFKQIRLVLILWLLAVLMNLNKIISIFYDNNELLIEPKLSPYTQKEVEDNRSVSDKETIIA